jgi:hypothetical protein
MADEPEPVPPPEEKDPHDEDTFFVRERAPSDIRSRPKPPSMVKRVGGIAIAAALLGGILWFSSSGDVATLWVVNPGPGPVTIEVSGGRSELEPGKILDTHVPAGPDVEVKVRRGRQTLDPIGVEMKPDKEEVALIDVGGEDAGYVVIDVSAKYKEGGGDDAIMPIKFVSKPHNLHILPFPALRMVRPGAPLPDKNSWEINAARGSSGTLSIFKVFRVDAKRLQDVDKLQKILNEAIRSKDATLFENMTVSSTTGPELLDGIIPKSR